MNVVMDARDRHRTGAACLWLAACAGCVHAGFSLYWAAGGTWLATVGRWAVQAAADGGPIVVGGLAGIGVLKLVAALAPAVVEQLRAQRLRRWIRGFGWVGAAGLTVYGGANTVAAALVLTGVVRPSGGYDRTQVPQPRQ